MSVFTVYCHGTGFNRIKGIDSNELVAWFHSHNGGVEASLAGGAVGVGSYLINEGPGHGGNGIEQPQQINPMTGSAKTGLSLKKMVLGPSFADHASGNTGGQKKMASLRGKISGQGWDENTQRTVNLIQDLKFGKGQAIDTVNLVGWSRGAVTCMRIANLMYEVFKTEVNCNIFAVDPVAGADAGEEMADTQVLESNVNRYVGILAMHEMRSTFKPQDWSRVRAPSTECIFLPMPGVHNAQVIPGTPPDAAYITRNLAAGLLSAWGTPVNSTPYGHLCSTTDMSIAYARLVLSLSEHKSYETKSIGGRIGGGTTSLRRRDFATHSKMDTYTRGGKESYWINEHHRACFADAFPQAYAAIFESTGSGEMKLTASSRLASFFQTLSRSAPLRQSLQAKGLLAAEGDGSFMMGIGVGRYANQVRCPWPADFPLHA
ncbi:MAG: hypothetical protein Q8N44_08335 [Rubrivivax sp.]|nr:hypothetical protein [Rubrivivax sp.]